MARYRSPYVFLSNINRFLLFFFLSKWPDILILVLLANIERLLNFFLQKWTVFSFERLTFFYFFCQAVKISIVKYWPLLFSVKYRSPLIVIFSAIIDCFKFFQSKCRVNKFNFVEFVQYSTLEKAICLKYLAGINPSIKMTNIIHIIIDRCFSVTRSYKQ